MRMQIITVTAGVTGFVLGATLAPFHQPTTGSASGVTPPAHALVTHADVQSPDNDLVSCRDIHTAMHEELESFRASLARPAPSPDQKSQPVTLTSSQVSAATRIQTAIDSAIARREWTPEDGNLLRTEMSVLSDAQREELLSKLAVAVNQGRLVPKSERFPF